MSIRLIVGLGNPGRDYADTRHNVGFVVADALAKDRGAGWRRENRFGAEAARFIGPAGVEVKMLKPQSYMNDSGPPVSAFCRFHRLSPEEVVVIFDEINLPTGRAKLSVTGSAGGHNGVASLLDHLGDGFRRFRIGIGPRHPPAIDLKDYVLGKLTPEQSEIISKNMSGYLDGLNLLLSQGTAAAMNQINRRTSPNDHSNQETL